MGGNIRIAMQCQSESVLWMESIGEYGMKIWMDNVWYILYFTTEEAKATIVGRLEMEDVIRIRGMSSN